MRLVCPNCVAQYEVADGTIPETGRDVQCANCHHIWFQDAAFKLSTDDIAPPLPRRNTAEADSPIASVFRSRRAAMYAPRPSEPEPEPEPEFHHHSTADQAMEQSEPEPESVEADYLDETYLDDGFDDEPVAPAPERGLPEVSEDIRSILRAEAEFTSRLRSMPQAEPVVEDGEQDDDGPASENQEFVEAEPEAQDDPDFADISSDEDTLDDEIEADDDAPHQPDPSAIFARVDAAPKEPPLTSAQQSPTTASGIPRAPRKWPMDDPQAQTPWTDPTPDPLWSSDPAAEETDTTPEPEEPETPQEPEAALPEPLLDQDAFRRSLESLRSEIQERDGPDTGDKSDDLSAEDFASMMAAHRPARAPEPVADSTEGDDLSDDDMPLSRATDSPPSPDPVEDMPFRRPIRRRFTDVEATPSEPEPTAENTKEAPADDVAEASADVTKEPDAEPLVEETAELPATDEPHEDQGDAQDDEPKSEFEIRSLRRKIDDLERTRAGLPVEDYVEDEDEPEDDDLDLFGEDDEPEPQPEPQAEAELEPEPIEPATSFGTPRAVPVVSKRISVLELARMADDMSGTHTMTDVARAPVPTEPEDAAEGDQTETDQTETDQTETGLPELEEPGSTEAEGEVTSQDTAEEAEAAPATDGDVTVSAPEDMPTVETEETVVSARKRAAFRSLVPDDDTADPDPVEQAEDSKDDQEAPVSAEEAARRDVERALSMAMATSVDPVQDRKDKTTTPQRNDRADASPAPKRDRKSLVEDRKVLLPDVDALNTSLRMDSREREKNLRSSAFEMDAKTKRSKFWLGLVTAMVLFGLIWAIYLLGPAISETIPALAPVIEAYRSALEAALASVSGLWTPALGPY